MNVIFGMVLFLLYIRRLFSLFGKVTLFGLLRNANLYTTEQPPALFDPASL